MPEVPVELIREVRARTREAAGFADYNPSDPSLPSLPSVSATIAVSDPSLLHFRCKNCKGRLLRGAESIICLYCGTRPENESTPDPISFPSTTGYQWLLHALNLNGTELVEPRMRQDQEEDQNIRKPYTPLSDFLNLKLFMENERHSSFIGVAPDKFFLKSERNGLSDTATGEARVDDFDTLDGNDFSRSSTQNLFQNMQSNTADSSSTLESSEGFAEWEANFQSANSESQHGNDASNFPSTSVVFEDKIHKSVKSDGSRNVDVDLSQHINSVFNVNDGNRKNIAGVSTEFDFSNSDDLQNLRPSVFNSDDFDAFLSRNDQKNDHNNFNDFSSSADPFSESDDLANLRPSMSNNNDGFGAFLGGNQAQKDDHTLDISKDLSLTASNFPDSDDLQNPRPNLSNTDDGFGAFLSENNGQKDDTLDISEDFLSSANSFPVSDYLENLTPNLSNTDDGFDSFLGGNLGQKDDHTLDTSEDFSSSANVFPVSDDMANQRPSLSNTDDDFGSFLSGNLDQKDDLTLDNSKDFSSSDDLFPVSDDYLNQRPNLQNTDDGFDAFVSSSHGQKDNGNNVKDFSSGADLFPDSDVSPSLRPNLSNVDDGFRAFLSGNNCQKDDHTLDISEDFSSSANFFPVSNDLTNLRTNLSSTDDGFGAFLSGNHGQKVEDTLDSSGFISSSANLFPVSDNLAYSDDGFGSFLSGNVGQKDVHALGNSKDFPSSSDLFPDLQSETVDKKDFSTLHHEADKSMRKDSNDELNDFMGLNRSQAPPKSAWAGNWDHAFDFEKKDGGDMSTDHLPSTSVEFDDKFQNSLTTDQSRNIDIDFDPLADSGIGKDVNEEKPINHAAVSAELDAWNLDDMWNTLSSVTSNGKKTDHASENLNNFSSGVDSFPHPQSQTTEVKVSKTQCQGHGEADEDPIDDWSGFMGSSISGDPSEHKHDGITPSDHLPSASVEFRDEFRDSEQFVKSKDLEVDPNQHIDSAFGALGDANDKKGHDNAAVFGGWNSDEMWKNMSPSVMNISVSYDSFINRKEDHTSDNPKDLANFHQEHTLSADDDPIDEWNDFMVSTSIQDPPKDASSEKKHGDISGFDSENKHGGDSSSGHLPSNFFESKDKFHVLDPFGGSRSLDDFVLRTAGRPKDVNGQRPNNAAFSATSGVWNSDDFWKNLYPNVSNNGGGFDLLFSTKDGHGNNHTFSDIKEVSFSADSFPHFQSQKTVSTNFETQHQEKEKTLDDENDEWNDFIGPSS